MLVESRAMQKGGCFFLSLLRFSANVMLACVMAMLCCMNYKTESESEEEEELNSLWNVLDASAEQV